MNYSEYSKYEEWKNPLNQNIQAINDWLEYGGLISYVQTKNGVELSTGEDADADFFDWLENENMKYTVKNEKEFCKSALEHANVPSEVIEELMENW